VIEVVHLSKAYGPVKALQDVSFSIKQGEIVGLLGPNGAGKTTIIKTLTGYLQPDEGTVHIGGLDVLTQHRDVQAKIGYLPETAPLYPELSVQTYLKMIAQLREIPQDMQLEYISAAVYAVGIQEYLTRPIGHLSKGYRQRVGIAQAMLHQPELLILDEPTIGLDPTQIVEVRNLIKDLSRQSTILFSTHILPEVELLCDRVIILMHGQIKADSRLADLATTADVILVLESGNGDVSRDLRSMDGVKQVDMFRTPEGHPAFRVVPREDDNLSSMVYKLSKEKNWPVLELRRDTRTLETVFNELATTA
jgi:ABC-2 type transport system ATP-binding protein